MGAKKETSPTGCRCLSRRRKEKQGMESDPTYMGCWHFIAPLIPVNSDYGRTVYVKVFQALKEAEEREKKEAEHDA